MKKKRRKRDYKALEKLTQVFELPGEVLGRSRMILTGNSDLFIENHCGICRYTLTEICVNVPGMSVHIMGDGLLLKTLGRENLIIYGLIREIKLEPECGGPC